MAGFDGEVLLALREGRASFEEAMKASDVALRGLARWVYWRVKSGGLAHCGEFEDAVQVCALRMWRGVDVWPGTGPIGGFVYDYVRKGAKQDFACYVDDACIEGGDAGVQDACEETVSDVRSPEDYAHAKGVLSRLCALPGGVGELARHMRVSEQGGGDARRLLRHGSYYDFQVSGRTRNRGKRLAFEELLARAGAQ